MSKSTLFAIALALPLLLQAAGMGISVPYNFNESERISYSSFDLHQTTFEYKPSTGLGFLFDTNIGKDRDFSYRLNLEYSLADIESSSRPYTGSFSKHKYSIINTFGFSIYHSPYIRLWVGPRVLIQYEHISNASEISRQNSYGFGFGAVTGLNVHLGPKVSLGADIDYHGLYLFGGESYHIADQDYYSVIAGRNKGATARFYLMLRIGETYEQNSKKPAESVIDYSL